MTVSELIRELGSVAEENPFATVKITRTAWDSNSMSELFDVRISSDKSDVILIPSTSVVESELTGLAGLARRESSF